MYNILVVDDEMLICQGVSNLLVSSGLSIGEVHIAYSGYEALDCIRMESIDLIISDIQMGKMSGIDLIQEARLIKPWIQSIIISAHEMFQYAQAAVRLGVRDYLVKPLNEEHLLVSVQNALMRVSLHSPIKESISVEAKSGFKMPEGSTEEKLLKLLVQDEVKTPIDNLLEQYIPQESDFSVIQIKLKLDQALSERDTNLLRYAALNISREVFYEKVEFISAFLDNEQIGILVYWSKISQVYLDNKKIDRLHELDMFGRSLHYNLLKYLKLHSIVGISQMMSNKQMLHKLFQQARLAISCSDSFTDHHVFYYGDFALMLLQQEEGEFAHQQRNNLIVEKAKEYIQRNYDQKGLTLHEIAQQNHVSPNYLSFLFKRHLGLNLWDYVIKLRMDESKRLLEHTDLRRYEIAERVGYESPEHFSKIFKKYFGVSPSELKKVKW